MRHTTPAVFVSIALSAVASAQPDTRPGTTPATKPPKPVPALKLPTKTPVPVPAAETVPPTDNSRTAVPFPQPLITEVLYAVPTGNDGDANRDGTRSATGDEFVELVNPHDNPIQLLGYTITDESQGDKSKLRFTFPAVELRPGQVALVFNGYGSSWTGPIGDSKAAPKNPNEGFDKALLFTMRITSNRAAFNNTGDSVTLLAPNNKPVQRIRWGTSAQSGAATAPSPGVLDEVLPETTKSSAQRSGILPGAAWRIHNELVPGIIFSPGRYEMDSPAEDADKPTPQAEPEKMVPPKPIVVPAKK